MSTIQSTKKSGEGKRDLHLKREFTSRMVKIKIIHTETRTFVHETKSWLYSFYLFERPTYLAQEMNYWQQRSINVPCKGFAFSEMYFPIVFDYFLPFSARVELDRGFPVLGEVRAQNVFSFSTRTVQLSFLKEQRLKNHSFLQVLEFHGTLATTIIKQNQDFDDNPLWGLAVARTAMAILYLRAAFVATQPFLAVFS